MNKLAPPMFVGPCMSCETQPPQLEEESTVVLCRACFLIGDHLFHGPATTERLETIRALRRHGVLFALDFRPSRKREIPGWNGATI